MIKKTSFIITALLLISVFAYAQEDVEIAEEVIVSASKTEKNIQDIPVSAVIVDEEGVKETLVQSVSEILKDIPGIEISTTASNGMRYVSIRGVSSKRTLLLVDGQPLSLQKSMEGPMALVGKSQIERIEVVKGPVSVLYGSEAIGGVVNIITKKGGEKPFGGSLNYSYDTASRGFRGDNVVNGSLNGIEYTFAFGLSRFGDLKTPDKTLDNNGKSTKPPYKDRISGTGSESNEYSGYLGYKNDLIHTGAKFEMYNSEYEVYTEDLMDTYNISVPPTDPKFQGAQDMTMNVPKSDRMKASAFVKLFELNNFMPVISLDGYYQYTERDFDIALEQLFPFFIDNTMHVHTHNEQKTTGLNMQIDFLFGSHYFVTGFDFKRDDIDGTEKTIRYIGSLTPPVMKDQDIIYDAWMNTYAFFIQDEWEIFDNFSLTGGGRYTVVSSELVETNDSDIPKKEDDTKDENLSFSLASIYHITDNLSLRGSYGSGYRYPNLVELFIGVPRHGPNDPPTGNPDLKPETSHSFELGTNYEGKYVYVDLAAFYTKAKDYISYDDNSYINIGGTDIFGAELSFNVDTHFYGITPYTDLTFMRKRYDYGSLDPVADPLKTVEDTWESGAPLLKGRFGIRHDQQIGKDISINSDLYSRFAAKSEIEYYDGEKNKSDAWFTLNFKTTFSWKDRINVYSGFTNILNEEYKLVGKFEIDSPGRSFFIGAGYKF